jgi:hypothetical protein
MPALPPAIVASFYRAAAHGLAALDNAPGGRRRFGPDADATWKAFRGELRDEDRLELLVRDAAAVSPSAFAPRVVFALDGLAGDEPFGPEWTGAPAQLAMTLLRESAAAKQVGVVETLRAVAAAWHLEPQPIAESEFASIGPASRMLVAGAGAILGLAQHASSRGGMDLADQALLVTDHPGHRQLFGMAAALLGSTKPAASIKPDAGDGAVRELGFPHVNVVLVSAGASSEAKATAQRLGGKAGG